MNYSLALAFALTSPVVLAQGGFSAPVLLSSLNSTVVDTNPHLSLDGLTVYFESTRTGGVGGLDFYASVRSHVGAPWSAPVIESSLCSTSSDSGVFVQVGSTEAYFSSNRAGSAPTTPGGTTMSMDIWRATRSGAGVPWTVAGPVTELNSNGGEVQFSMTLDGLHCFFLTTGWSNPGGANNSIYTSTRLSSALPWDPPTLVSELYNGKTHRDVEISPDGLTLTYNEYQPSPIARMYVLSATRPDRSSPFATPTQWTEFNTVGTLQGVFGLTLSYQTDEIIVGAGFAASAGSQELLAARRSPTYGVGCGTMPLRMTATPPTLGANWDLTTSDLEASSPLAFQLIGLSNSNLPLAGLGAPGCTQYVDALLATLTPLATNGSATSSIGLPNATALAGMTFFLQSAGLSQANPLGVSFSNGVVSLISQ